MFEQWQDALATEEERSAARAKRREARRVRKQRRIQRELQKEVNRNKKLMQAESRFKSSTSKGKGSNAFQHETSQPSPNGKIAAKHVKPLHDMAAENISRAAAAVEGNTSMIFDDSMSSLPPRKGVPRTKSLQSLMAARSKSPHKSPKQDLGSFGSAIPKIPVLQRGHEGVRSTPTTPGSQTQKNPKSRSRNLLSRFGMRRAASSEKLEDEFERDARCKPAGSKLADGVGLPHSPSMPLIALSTMQDSFPEKDEELGYHFSSTSVDAVASAAKTNKKTATIADQSKSVVIDMPPDDVLEVSDEGEVADATDTNDLGIVI